MSVWLKIEHIKHESYIIKKKSKCIWNVMHGIRILDYEQSVIIMTYKVKPKLNLHGSLLYKSFKLGCMIIKDGSLFELVIIKT